LNMFKKIVRIILIVFTAFLALTTFLGGIALIINLIKMPLELLQGSLFKDYTIPGLALSVLVTGSALVAFILLLRKSKYSLLFSTMAGVVIMFFEFVEVLTIGSPVGIARTLQILYFGLGTFIVVASMVAWFLDLWSGQGAGKE
jgi:hypothetical protein